VASLSAANGVVSGGGRSAGYGELFEAAMRQPIPEKVALKDPKNFKLIGQPTGLKVSRAKSSGAQTYGIDIRLPGMLTAVIAHPPTFGAKVKSFDGAAALKIKGVRAVLPVALDRGAQGVAIVATGYWPAKQGRDALKIDWDTSGVDKPDTDRLLTQYRELARSGGKPAPGAQFNADVSAMAQAPNKLSAEFVFPYLNHAQLEPLACTVDLKPDRCDLHYASQMPGVDAGAVARAPCATGAGGGARIGAYQPSTLPSISAGGRGAAALRMAIRIARSICTTMCSQSSPSAVSRARRPIWRNPGSPASATACAMKTSV